MIYYLVFGVSVVAVLLAVGIPAVTRLVKIPGRVRLRPVDENEISEDTLSYFKTTDSAVSEPGFQHVVDFIFPGHAAKNENRLYYRPSDGTTLVISVQRSGARSERLFEFVTSFEDGTEVTTTNAPVSLVFEEPPWQEIKRMPGSTRIERVFDFHKKRVEKKQASVHYPDEDRLLEEISQSQEKLFRYQVETGLFREDEETGMYVATSKVALRTVANILNPFTEEFTPPRFAAGFGGALALFSGAVFLLQKMGVQQAMSDAYGAEQGTYLSFSPAFVLAGLVAGLAFTRKGFMWGFLISLPSILLALLFQPTLSHPIFYSLISAQSGKVANVITASSRQESARPATSTALLVLFALLVLGFYYLN